jgi:MFS family permease
VATEKSPSKRFAALILGGGFYQAGCSTVTTIIGPLLNSRGISAEQIGFLNSANWAVVTLASIPAGRLSDRLGRLVPFVVSAVAAAAAWGALYLKVDLTMSLVAFILAGLSLALFTPNSTAIISERFSPRIAPILFAVFYLATWGGAAVASVLSGWASENLGAATPLLISSLLFAVSGIALTVSAWSNNRHDASDNKRSVRHILDSLNIGTIVSSVKNNPLLAFYGFALFFHSLGYQMITPYLSLYAEKAIGLDIASIGLAMAAWNAGMMVGIIPCGWISTKVGSEVTLVGHFILSAASWSAITLSRDLTSAAVLLFFFGLVGSMDLPARRALTAELSLKDKLAEATGFIELVNGIGGLLGSLFGGFLFQGLGPAFPFYFGPLMTLLSVPPMLKLAGRVRKGQKSTHEIDPGQASY